MSLKHAWGSKVKSDKQDPAFLEAQKQRAERVTRADRDPQFFCSYYLPHYFPTPLANWQSAVIEDADEFELSVYAVPRGHGKTTFIGFALTLRDLLRGRSRFTVYVGPTKSAACDRITEIKMELETNERILEDYGDQLAGNAKRTADDLTLANGARIVARGAAQSLRGLKNKQHRPDRMIIDDIDDEKKAIPDLKQVQKKINWFNTVVMGMAGAAGMQVICIGNVIARKTFLTHCLAHRKFNSRVYRAIQPDGTPLMPALWSIEKLLDKKEAIGPTKFETEYQNNPPSEGTRPFRPDWLTQRWDHDRMLFVPRNTTVALDLSAAKNERSDFQGIVAVRRDKDGNIYVAKADIDRRSRKALIARLFSFCEAIGLDRITSVVIEANGFQEWVKQEIDELSAELGYDLPIHPITHTIDKYSRVAKLAPIAEGGRLWFPPDDEHDDSMSTLLSQMEMFPDDDHDDGPDALAMAVEETGRLLRGTRSRSLPVGPFDREADDWRNRP